MTAKIYQFEPPKDSLKGVIDAVSKGEKVVFWYHNCKYGKRTMKIIRGFACRKCGAIAVGHRLGPYEDNP